ncbi:MAG: addiction module protein [Candidatus Delongbacteria bacterium]|nr:addiction module protein [Candidatus Delongbacteria bacterium]
MITKELKKETLHLNPIDKIQLVELILESLSESDPEIETAWVAESEARYSSYKAGKTEAVSLDSVKKRLKK